MGGEIVQQIKNPRVVTSYFTGTVVPEEAIDVMECSGNVVVISAIDDVQAFPGVHVEELEPILASGGCRAHGRMNRCGSRKSQSPRSHHPYQ